MKGSMSSCMLEMTLVFSIVTIAYFALFFDITTTFHATEKLMTDARLPYLQGLSYSTAQGTACERNPRVYNLLVSAVLAGKSTIKVCDKDLDVSGVVKEKWKNFSLEENNNCYFFTQLKADGADALFTAGSCPTGGSEALSRSYLMPLPPDENGEPRLTKEKITKVKK